MPKVARQKLRDVPEFHAFVMPPSNSTSAQLVAHATAMAEAARVHEQVFTEVGLPDDFLSSMLAVTAEVSKSIDDRKQHAGRRNGATAGLAAEERRGRSMLKLIDALIVPRLRNNDALLGEWRAAKRVPRKPGPVTTTAFQPVVTSDAVAPVATIGK